MHEVNSMSRLQSDVLSHSAWHSLVVVAGLSVPNGYSASLRSWPKSSAFHAKLPTSFASSDA